MHSSTPVWTAYAKSLIALKGALATEKSDISRDASNHRFTLCIDLAWKTAKKLLNSPTPSPRIVIREMAAQELIPDATPWLGFLDVRNSKPYAYRDEVAAKVYVTAREFLSHGEILLGRFKGL